MKKHRLIATNYNDISIVKKYSTYPLIHRVVGKPQFLKFIGNVSKQRILDFGCGNGHITFELKKRGATCVGVDPSKLFIAEAWRKYPDMDFRLIRRSQLDGIKSNYFDKVIMSLVLPSLNSKKEFKTLFKEASRVLKTNGELIFSTLHPLMVRNMEDRLRKVRMPSNMDYFSSGAKYQNDLLVIDNEFMTFTNIHWTLEDISNELAAYGFVIVKIKEPKMAKNKYWNLLKDVLYTPYHIFFKAKKLDV